MPELIDRHVTPTPGAMAKAAEPVLSRTIRDAIRQHPAASADRLAVLAGTTPSVILAWKRRNKMPVLSRSGRLRDQVA